MSQDRAAVESPSGCFRLRTVDPWRFAREKPRDTAGYDRVFGCPVAFGQPSAAVVFDRAATSLPLRAPQTEVARYLEGLAQSARAALPRDDVGGAVSEVARAMLTGGCSLKASATIASSTRSVTSWRSSS